jgi:hypothetical protein
MQGKGGKGARKCGGGRADGRWQMTREEEDSAHNIQLKVDSREGLRHAQLLLLVGRCCFLVVIIVYVL